MITSSDKNVELTFEQLQQIDVAQKQLANIQSEVSLATKNLGVLGKDCDKVTKERIWQEELLANLNTEVAKKSAELERMNSEIATVDALLKDNTEKAKTVGNSNEIKRTELKQIEAELLSAKSKHEEAIISFDKQNTQLQKEIASVQKAKDAFSKAIEAVEWN